MTLKTHNIAYEKHGNTYIIRKEYKNKPSEILWSGNSRNEFLKQKEKYKAS